MSEIAARDELTIAEEMVAGTLPSPQLYGTFVMFCIRITGTGLSYRMGRDEYVWRDASLYLNDRFLRRTQGLPVIWDHPPEKPTLDSEEFNNRIVGTTFIPFIKNEDVWAVVKIYDKAAIELMLDDKLSTSPAVVFKASTSSNESIPLDDGQILLIEGEPALLDHIAIVSSGVWDKGGPPSGVDIGALNMADENEKEAVAADKARHDASEDKKDSSKFDAFMDSMMEHAKRMDARFDALESEMDKMRKDSDEEEKKDSARKDEKEEDCAMDKRKDSEEEEEKKDSKKDSDEDEEKEEKKDSKKDSSRKDESFEKWAKEEGEEKEHKKDSARQDAQVSKMLRENDDLRRQLSALSDTVKGMRREVSTQERDALASAQARADSVLAMFGDRAPEPIPGESSIDYRRRLATRLKQHSPQLKDMRFDSIDANALGLLEDRVYADAVSSARIDVEATPGQLVPFETIDPAGRRITKYHGDIGAFIAPFGPSQQQYVRVNRNPNAA